jgi:hypothetical protein
MKNLGQPDRVIRIVLGLALIALPLFSAMAIFASPMTYWLSIVVGLVLAGTALVGFCPLYAIFGMSTSATKR